MSTHFDALYVPGQTWHEPQESEGELYMRHWYATLFIVVEGWKQLGLHDAAVDQLIGSSKVELLRQHHRELSCFDPALAARGRGSRNPDLITIVWARALSHCILEFFHRAGLVQPEQETRPAPIM